MEIFIVYTLYTAGLYGLFDLVTHPLYKELVVDLFTYFKIFEKDLLYSNFTELIYIITHFMKDTLFIFWTDIVKTSEHPQAANILGVISIIITIIIIPIKSRHDKSKNAKIFSSLLLEEVKSNRVKTEKFPRSRLNSIELNDSYYQYIIHQGLGIYLELKTQKALVRLYSNIQIYNRLSRTFVILTKEMHSIFDNPKVMDEFLNKTSQTTSELHKLKETLEEEYSKCIVYLENEEKNAYSILPYYYQLVMVLAKISSLKNPEILVSKIIFKLKGT